MAATMTVYGWMSSMTRSFNVGVETVMLISCVMDSSDRAIRFVKSVVAFYDITITFFVLFLMIASMLIFNAIFKIVFGIRLISIYMHVSEKFCIAIDGTYMVIMNVTMFVIDGFRMISVKVVVVI